MTKYIAITIMVPAKDIEIEASPVFYEETRHEPSSWDANVACIDIPGLKYEIDQDSYNDKVIDDLAIERFEEQDNE